MDRIAFSLPALSVPVFNLLKYFLMTYVVGLMWDTAYENLVETKRYFSLWTDGYFFIGAWGRSRNNLFSGNTFEGLRTMFRCVPCPLRKCLGKYDDRKEHRVLNTVNTGEVVVYDPQHLHGNKKSKELSASNAEKGFGGDSQVSAGSGILSKRVSANSESKFYSDGQNESESSISTSTNEEVYKNSQSSSGKGRFARTFCREAFLLVILLLVVFSEAISELYTDAETKYIVKSEKRRVPVRSNSSVVIGNPAMGYSINTDILLARRCSEYNKNEIFIVRPNVVAEAGEYYQGHNQTPLFNYSLLCLYDKNLKDSRVKVEHSPIEKSLYYSNTSTGDPEHNEWIRKQMEERRRKRFRKLKTLAHEEGSHRNDRFFSSDNILHRYFVLEFVKKLDVPEFFKPQEYHFKDQNNPRVLGIQDATNYGLLLAEVNTTFGSHRYTCTVVNPWCIRELGDNYEVIYFHGSEDNLAESMRKLKDKLWKIKLPGTIPFNISKKTVPLLAGDRHMLRPKILGTQLEDLQENLLLVAIGYNFGWSTMSVKLGKAIVSVEEDLVPIVKIGYVVSIGAIIMISLMIVSCNALASRNRTVKGLVGERAFIERWHKQLEGKQAAQWRRSVVATGNGANGDLQPLHESQGIPLSKLIDEGKVSR